MREAIVNTTTHNSQLATRNWIWMLLGVLIIGSCTPSAPAEEVTDLPIPAGAVMILNEGNYTYGNASISYYNPATGNVFEDIFKSQNNRPLGDVAQSMVGANGYGYIVVNNSNKIEVVNLVDFKNVATITGLTSPRYVLPLGDGRAYVSDLYAEKLSIINLNNNTKTAEIDLPGWTEQMVLAAGKVFVANYDSQRVEIIDPATNTKTNHISVGGHPLEILLDANGKIWVLGQKEGNVAAVLTRINANSETTELTLPFANNETPTDLITDAAGNQLYFINTEGIYRMAIADIALPNTPLIPKNDRNYYAIGITPDNGQLYASDVLDFNQRSNIYVFATTTGQQTASINAGIISGGFYFYSR